MTQTATATTATRLSTARTQLAFGHIIRSEWIKLRSLRSTVWSYTIVVIMSIGLAALGSLSSNFDGLLPDHQTQIVVQASTFGIYFDQLVIAVLGVLVISGEYSTGMIRSTLTTVPRRLPALWAKAIVLFTTTFIVGAISMFGAMAVAVPILAGKAIPILGVKGIHADFTDAHIFLIPLAGALYLALSAVFALGIGAVLRNSAGGIAAVLGIILLLPNLWTLIPGQWAKDAAHYLLPNAGVNFVGAGGATIGGMEPWQNLLVILAWIAASLSGAALLLKRRDA
jgi:ABC-2 type transport system permease protein